jgi:hypothetical protein
MDKEKRRERAACFVVQTFDLKSLLDNVKECHRNEQEYDMRPGVGGAEHHRCHRISGLRQSRALHKSLHWKDKLWIVHTNEQLRLVHAARLWR